MYYRTAAGRVAEWSVGHSWSRVEAPVAEVESIAISGRELVVIRDLIPIIDLISLLPNARIVTLTGHKAQIVHEILSVYAKHSLLGAKRIEAMELKHG